MRENSVRITLQKGAIFQEGEPEQITTIAVKAESGYECIIPKNSQAYLYVDTIEMIGGSREARTHFSIITSEETEDFIIDDVIEYNGMYLTGYIVEVKEKAWLYNCHIRKKIVI